MTFLIFPYPYCVSGVGSNTVSPVASTIAPTSNVTLRLFCSKSTAPFLQTFAQTPHFASLRYLQWSGSMVITDGMPWSK